MATSYKIKYTCPFKDISNTAYSIEIWQLTDDSITPVSSIVKADENPFSVSLSVIESKFQPVRGTGCKINLISEYNMQFIDLFTADMFEYQIRFYQGSTIKWLGYLDSELYTEPFNELTNYQVSFSGSDGFALLDRLQYLQDDGTRYTGLSRQIDVIKLILQKLNLPVLNTYIKLATSFSGSSMLLYDTFLINANFYDEDDEPFTLRKVLESILEPYSAFIMQTNGTYWITDLQSVVADSLDDTEKWYGNISYFIGYENISANMGDLSTLKFASSEQSLNIVSGVNKQIVKYSPYDAIKPIDYSPSLNKDFETITGTTTRGLTNYQWTETVYDTSQYWERWNNGKFCSYVGVDGDNVGKKETYLNIPNYGVCYHVSDATKSFVYKKNLPFIVPTNDYKLKIEMSAYVRLSDNMGGTPTTTVQSLKLITRLKLGTYHYCNAYLSTGWTTGATSDLVLPFTDQKAETGTLYDMYNSIDERWTELLLTAFPSYSSAVKKYNLFIPIDAGVNILPNELEFAIYGYQCVDFGGSLLGTTVIKDVRIKDFKITVVDLAGNEIEDNDVEYVGYMNKQYSNEGSSIDLIQGTNTINFPVEYGGLLYYDGTKYCWLTEWTRGGVTDNIENLLLRSHIGNYESKSLEISATTNLLTKWFGYLTYSNYLSSKKFMITSYTNNYSEKTTSFTMQEIFADSLTINKSF